MLPVYRTSSSSSQHSCTAQLQTCPLSSSSMRAAWHLHWLMAARQLWHGRHGQLAASARSQSRSIPNTVAQIQPSNSGIQQACVVEQCGHACSNRARPEGRRTLRWGGKALVRSSPTVSLKPAGLKSQLRCSSQLCTWHARASIAPAVRVACTCQHCPSCARGMHVPALPTACWVTSAPHSGWTGPAAAASKGCLPAACACMIMHVHAADSHPAERHTTAWRCRRSWCA